jgi:hypothetical protein
MSEISGTENGEVVGTENDARLALFNSIADNADRERAEELADINDDGSLTEFVAPAAENVDVEVAEPVTEAAPVEAQAPTKHKLKVNGREIELTFEEMRERAQKVESADMYLAEAARLRQALVPAPSTDVRPDANMVEDDLALVRAIQIGTEEEALQAIRKLKSNGPSQDDLARTVDERITFKEAIHNFNTQFSDIVGDPYLKKLALDTDAQLIANGDRRPYAERYAEIGNNLREWVRSKAPAPQEAAPVVDKESRKAAVSTAPKVASAKTASSLQEEKEDSVADTIASIARARGPAQWMNSAR